MPTEASRVASDPQSTGSVSTAERLRDAARELFAERGYAGASLGEICARVGIRKPSVYNHYPSKEALFLDLLERSLADWRDAGEISLDHGGSCREALRRHLHATVEFAVQRPHATALCRVAVSQVGGDLERRAQELLLTQRRQYQDSLHQIFEAAKERGEVVDEPTLVLVLGWLTFLDGILSHQLFGLSRRRSLFFDHLDALWRLYWRGVSSKGT